MPGNDLEEARAILASGGTGDKAIDGQLQALVEAASASTSHGNTGGYRETAPPLSRIRREALVPLDKPLKLKKLPTAYTPTDLKNDYPILYTEPSPTSTSDPEAEWEQAMADADKRGQKIYRVEKEFPVTGDGIPLGQRAQNALVRAGTDVVTPLVFGADKSITGGLATKGSVKALEKTGVVPEGTLGDVNRQVASSPITAGVGTMLGAMTPGLASGAGKLANAATKGLMTSPLKKAAGYGLAGGLAGGLTGAVESGVGSAMGENRDIATDTAASATIGALGNMVFGGLGELGRNRVAALRDPQRSDVAKDIALVERAGARNKLIGGFTPDKATPQGQRLKGELDELSASARESGQGIDALAANRASKRLGEEVAGYQGEVLRRLDEQNQALYANEARVSADRLVKKNLELLRKATHPDGGELPGHTVSALGKEMPKLANVRLVDAASDEALSADPEMVLPAAMASKLGIVRGGNTAGKVVVLEPKSFSAEELDSFTRSYHQQANLGVYDPTGSKSEFGKLAHEGVVTRGRFGAGVEKMKLEQGKALNDMKNTLEAAGLPRDVDVDLTKQGTKDALYRSMRGYKNSNTVPADETLDALASRSPALRGQMDQAAAVGALQRLHGKATPDIAMGQGGIRPYGALGSAKLKLDPIFAGMGRMGERVPGLPYGAGLIERKRR